MTPLIQSGDNWKTLNNFKLGVSKEWQCYLPFSTHLNPHSCFVLVGLGHNARCVGLNNMFFKTLLPLLLLVPGFYFQSQVGIMYHPKIKTEKKLHVKVHQWLQRNGEYKANGRENIEMAFMYSELIKTICYMRVYSHSIKVWNALQAHLP